MYCTGPAQPLATAGQVLNGLDHMIYLISAELWNNRPTPCLRGVSAYEVTQVCTAESWRNRSRRPEDTYPWTHG